MCLKKKFSARPAGKLMAWIRKDRIIGLVRLMGRCIGKDEINR